MRASKGGEGKDPLRALDVVHGSVHGNGLFIKNGKPQVTKAPYTNLTVNTIRQAFALTIGQVGGERGRHCASPLRQPRALSTSASSISRGARRYIK